MLGIWGYCRALSNGHDVYDSRAQQPHMPADAISWDPLLPWYWKLILPAICFAVTSILPFLISPWVKPRWEWWSWSMPTGILSSFAILHSGLFGTLGALKLTTASKITDIDQLAALIGAVVFIIAQYGTHYYRGLQDKRQKKEAEEREEERERRGQDEWTGTIPVVQPGPAVGAVYPGIETFE